jgi:hypothetical protein
MAPVDIEGAIDPFVDFSGQANVFLDMLPAEIDHFPIFRQVLPKRVNLFDEILDEYGIILKDQDGWDFVAQAIFQNAEMGFVAAPRTVSTLPPIRRRSQTTIHGDIPLWMPEGPTCGDPLDKCIHPFPSSGQIDHINAFKHIE